MFPRGAACSRCSYTPASKYLPGLDKSPEASTSSVSQVHKLWLRAVGKAYLTMGLESHCAKGPLCSPQSTDCPHRLGTLQPWGRWHETPDIASTQYLLGTHQFTTSQKPPGGESLGPVPMLSQTAEVRVSE